MALRVVPPHDERLRRHATAYLQERIDLSLAPVAL